MSLTLAATLMASLPGYAHAQAATAKPPQAPAGTHPDDPADVIVSAQRPDAGSAIDRKTYQVSHDLQSSSGSASDVLRNLPAVQVDAQGNISLRGDTSVQILIDGKPSTTMNSANRADALEQLPANTIDHVEVITNPSAQFKPDGSAGIINIVTRKDRKAGLSGSVSVSGGSDGRFNIAGNATYRSGPLTATASATLHRDMRWRPFVERRSETDPATGLGTASTQDSLFHGEKLSRILTGGVDYDLTARDRLSASGTYNRRTGSPQLRQHDRVVDPAGAVTSDFDRTGTGDEHELSDEASAKYRHAFAQKGRFLTLDLRRGETIESETRRFTDDYDVPAGLVTIDQQSPHLNFLQRELTAEYAQPLWGGKFLAGYDVQRDDDDFRNRGELIDPVTDAVTVDPAHSYRFVYDQTIHALHATYDREMAKGLSAIFGIRLEQAIIHSNQVDLALTSRQSYFRVYPTLHLQYDVAGGQKVKLSYSHRVTRPDPEDLNPYPVYSDPLNLRAGNPGLKPKETDLFEAGYQYEAHGMSWEATLFLRRNRNEITDVSRVVAPLVLLTTKENLGSSMAAGMDFSGNGKFSRLVSYRLSGTVSHNRIDASNLGFSGTRSAWVVTAKGGLDFQLARPDLVQISASYNGKRLTPQGYRLSSAVANIGYRHRFHDGLVAVLSLSDIFDSQRERSLIDSDVLHSFSTRRNTRRTLSLALTLPLGGGKTGAETPFDFGD